MSLMTIIMIMIMKRLSYGAAPRRVGDGRRPGARCRRPESIHLFIHGAAIGARPVRRRQRVSLAREIRNLPQRQTGPQARPREYYYYKLLL